MLVRAIAQSRKTHRARPQVANHLRLVLVVALAGLLCSLASPASAAGSRVGSANQLAVPQPVLGQSTRGGVAKGNAVIGWGVDYLGGVGVGDTSPEIGNWEVTYPTPVAVTPALDGRTVTKVSPDRRQGPAPWPAAILCVGGPVNSPNLTRTQLLSVAGHSQTLTCPMR